MSIYTITLRREHSRAGDGAGESKALFGPESEANESSLRQAEIVHAVNVTLEVTADLKRPNQIVWYRDNRRLTSSERPILFKRVKSAAGATASSLSSVRRTRSKRTSSSAQGYSVEETVVEEEHLVSEDKENQGESGEREVLVAKCQQESSERGSKLTIFDLQDDDYGQYTCKLIDTQGKQLDIHAQLKQDSTNSSSSKRIQSDRHIRRRFDIQGTMDEVIEVKEGDLNIELGIQILPETNDDEELMSEEEKDEFILNTTITWFKDDVKLSESDPEIKRLFQFSYDKSEGFHRLIVLKATKETEGVYTCLVENDSGTSSCSTQLVVGPGNKPKLTSRLQDVTVYVGQQLEFRIKSTGLPPIDSCQWFKDDELLVELDSGKTHASSAAAGVRISMSREEGELPASGKDEDRVIIFRLCIDSMKLDDTGRYRCRINNQFGYDETDCFVKVLQEIIEEHEEVEEMIEETRVLGGGIKSTRREEEEEEEQQEVVEEETTTTVAERALKRQKQEESGEGRAPKFVRRLADRCVIIDETTTITETEMIVSTLKDERSSSRESLRVRWFVDGEEINERRGDSDHQVENFYDETASEWLHRLRIRSSSRETKRYSCSASNEFGQDETSCTLRRVKKPKFLRTLEDAETNVGETVVLKVTVDASDELDDLRFLKDNRVVYSSKTDASSGESTTSVKSASKSRIRMRTYEEIIEEEETTTTTRYTRRRSSLLSQSSRRRRGKTYELTIEDVQVDQMGTWECQAENEAGTNTCRADLEVFAEPKIVTDLPEQVRVPPSKEIRLTVEASGSPTPVYSWFKDGVGIAEQEDRVFTETKTTKTESTTTTTKRRSSVTSMRSEDGVSISGETLIIRDARPEDAGSYQCKIENRLGQVQSRDCKLTIIGHGDDTNSAPRIIKDFARNQLIEIDEGETVLLKVIAEGQPKPRQFWYKDTEEIVERTSRLEVENEGQEYRLVMKRTEEVDSGKYRVILRNDFGETESRTVEVKINKITKERESQRRPSAPKILTECEDKTVGLGSNISFDVQVGGHPKPLITWYKNGRRLTESGDGRVSFVEEETTTTVIEEEEDIRTGEKKQTSRQETTTIHKLVITNVRETDEAIYSLKAENDLGSVKSSLVSLTVDKRKESVDELSESARRQAEAVTEEEETTTTTKTVTKTKTTTEVDDAEDTESLTSSRTRTKTEEEVEEDEDELGGKRRTTTRTTRTTTTTTTTTEEEDAEAQRQRQREDEDESRQTSRKTSKRTTRVDEDDESASRVVQVEEEEERVVKRELIEEQMEVDQEAVEEEEITSKRRRSQQVEEETKTKKRDSVSRMTEREDVEAAEDSTTKSRRRESKSRTIVEDEETRKDEDVITRQRRAPRVISAPKQVVAGLGSSPEIEVEIETITTTVVEEKETKVRWLKDDEEISSRLLRDSHIEITEESTDVPGVKKHVLRINSLRSSDAGKYKLQVENPIGKVDTEDIDVQVDRSMRPGEKPKVKPADIEAPIETCEPAAPEITRAPDEIVAGVGSSPMIEAEIKGQPKPDTTWFKDGQPIPEDELKSGHLEIVDLPSEQPDVTKQGLKINNLKPADVAAYHVKAENPLGEVESEPTNLRIDRSMGPKDEPLVTQQEGLGDEGVVPMETEPIAEDTIPTRKISAARQPDETAVPEKQAPQLLDAPKEVKAPLGSSPVLEVEVKATPEAAVAWTKDGEPIPARLIRDGHVEIKSEPTSVPGVTKEVLKINDMRPSDAADYKIKANNPLGEIESAPIKLKADRSMSRSDEPVVVRDEQPTETSVMSARKPSKAGSVGELAPEIVSVPEEVVAGPGSSPVIAAEVKGQPKPELSWFKDGKLLTDKDLSTGHLEIVDLPAQEPNSTKQALKINDMKPTDAAAYHVKAKNPLGEVESEPTNLRIDRSMGPTDEPQVTPTEAAVPSDASSQPEAPRKPSTVTDDLGHKVAPQIVDAPKEVKAPLGSSPALEVEVKASPEAKVTWTKDGEPIPARLIRDGHVELASEPTQVPGITKQVLKINDLRPSDAADYKVKAENPLGEVESSPIKLKADRSMSRSDEPVVTRDIKPTEDASSDARKPLLAESAGNLAPQVVSMPEEVVAGAGSSPLIEAEIRGEPKPELSWFKDGQPIPEKDLRSGHLEVVDLPSDKPDTVKQALKINDLKPIDAAAYHIKAENPVGDVESEPTNLRIDRSMGPRDEPVVTQQEGLGEDDTVPMDTEPIGEDTAPGRRISATQQPDETAVAEKQAPELIDAPKEVIAPLGSSPVLEVEVKATPEAAVTWTKDGEPIPARLTRDGHVEVKSEPTSVPGVTKEVLKVNDMRPSDAADYRIKAENPLGEVESAPIKLKADRSMSRSDEPVVIKDERQPEDSSDQSAPQLVSVPKEVKAPLGSSPALEVDVKASPKADVTWLKDGEPIPARLLRDGHIELKEEPSSVPGVTRQVLKVNDMRPSDAADYTVKATNPLGEAESSPIKLKLDRSMSRSDEPVVVRDEQPESETAPVDTRKPSRSESTGNLAPQILSAPEEIVTGSGSSPIIEAEIRGQPKPDISWFKDGQPIPERDLQSGHLELVDLPTDQPDTVKQGLKINNLRPADVAAYHVKAENPLGEVESEPTNLRIDRSMGPRDEPVITAQEIDDSVVPMETSDDAAPRKVSFAKLPGAAETAPRLVDVPKEVVAALGSSPALDVAIEATPKATVTWTKDGEPIPARLIRDGHVVLKEEVTPVEGVTKYTLEVNDMRPSDAAEYKIKAENPLGEVESAPIKLRADRSMSRSDEPVIVKDDQPSDSSASARRSPSLADTTGALVAPEIVSMPDEVVSGLGSSPMIEAEIKGQPKPDTTWFKDGQPIPDEELTGGHLKVIDLPSDKPDVTKQGLQINNLKPADVAAYHVKAENPAGEIESEPTNLRIDRTMGPRDEPVVSKGAAPHESVEDSTGRGQKPQISAVPRNIKAPLGSSPVVDVEVKGGDLSPAEIEWLKDGRKVKETPDMHIEFEDLPDGTHKLHINNFKPHDEGVYTLRAKNDAGTAESGPITLTAEVAEPRRPSESVTGRRPSVMVGANDMAPEILNMTEDITAGPGSYPRLEVDVKASPQADITWYKDGRPITERQLTPGHMSLAEEKSPYAPDAIKYVLKIDKFKPADAATYHLVAMNPLGTAETKPIHLKLEKLLASDDVPLVKMMVPDEQLAGGLGEYAPQIISVADEVVAGIMSSPQLEAIIKSKPEPETTWFKDGQPIDDAMLADGHLEVVREKMPDADTIKDKLIIHNLKPDDAAAYHVKAENPLGEVESAPTNVRIDRSMKPDDEPVVTKTETPFSPEEAAESAKRPAQAPTIRRIPRKIVAALGSNPSIDVEVAGEPKPDVVWFKDGRQVSAARGHIALIEQPDGTYKLAITNLKAVDQGDYTLKATNEAGEVQSAPISLVIDSGMSPAEEPHVIDSSEVSPTSETVETKPARGFAPSVVRVSDKITAPLQASARIEIDVKAQPQASISWFKDGSSIPSRLFDEGHVHAEETKLDEDVTRYTLVVDSLKPSDAATYHIEAENPFGSTKSPSVGVTLRKSSIVPEEETGAKPKRKLRAPTIKRVPRQVVAAEGTSPVLEVEVSGEPVPEIIWFKNGKRIERTDAHYSMDYSPESGVCRLTVHKVVGKDEGVYTVQATNEAGTAESGPIELKVETAAAPTNSDSGYAPQVVKITDEVVAGVGSSPVMEVVIQASPRAEVTWFKDGQPITTAEMASKFETETTRVSEDITRYTLTIKNLKPVDVAAYHVRAENPFGEVESAPVNVRIDRSMGADDAPQSTATETPFEPSDETPKRRLRAPVIKRMPRKIVAAIGSSPVIEVEVSGEPKPEVIWYKNGRRVTEVRNHIAIEQGPDGKYRLCFTNLKATDQAEYTITATNEAGTVESSPIQLVVDRTMSKNAEPFVQMETDLPADLSEFNGKPVEAPVILNLKDQEALPGQTVKLEAEVLGNPKPDIKWLKDGDEVELNILNEVPDSNKHSLTLKNVNDLYDGVYSLEARNIAGVARKDAAVKIVDQLTAKPEPTGEAFVPQPSEVKRKQPEEREVREKPFIKKGLKFSQVNQGRTIKFEVQIDGKYDELIWTKDGEQINVPVSLSPDDEVPMEADEDDVSTIRGESPEDDFGDALLTGDDLVAGKPRRRFAPRILSRPRNVVAGPGSRVAFELKVEGEPKPEIHWFKNGERIVQTSDGKIIVEEYAENCHRLIIEDVRESDVAEYHVVAENPYGSERTIPVSLELDADMVASDDLANTTGVALDGLPSSLSSPDSPLKRGRAPRILSRPKPVHAGKGSKVFFEVQVSGEPEPIVNWFRDGRVIKQSSDGHVTIEEYSNGYVRLVLSDITDADVGQYHVVAENKLGSERTIPVSLTIDETSEATELMEEFVEIASLDSEEQRRRRGGRPPRILLRPKRLHTAPGGEVTLEVSVVGQSKPSIIWHKNGKRITSTADGHIRIEEISEGYQRLVISNVTSKDSGAYTVSAENDFGVSMSQPAELLVDETITTTTETSETTETFFERFVSDGSAGDALSPSGKRAPRFTLRPRNKKAPLGSKVDFEVRVSGEPKPDVVWYKNGRRVHTSADGRVRVEEFSDGGSKLVIEDLEETDHGVYAAEASNEMGRVRTDDVQLRVTQRTEVSEHRETRMRGSAKVSTRTKRTTSHYTFSEERHGYVTLTISDAQLEHDGDYKLVVRNKWGEARTQAPLVVIPKVEPRATPSADRSYTQDGDSSLDGRDSRARRTPFDELEDYGHELDRSVGVFGSESRYQSGEDTYLLQLRDTEFPLRLRKYLRFGARQSPSLRSNLMDAHWGAGARVTVRERRKFREVMDEEIDDEKRGLDTRPTPMRLQKEVGTCGYAAAQLESLRVEAAERVARRSAEPSLGGTPTPLVDMMPPFFRVKLKDAVVEESGAGQQEAVFACLATGEPKPDYTWYRNDILITPDANRMLLVAREDGGSELHIRDPRLHDAGCFKCVAGNAHGNVTCRARLRVASRPSRPEPAEYVSVSSREVFLQWRPPRDFDTNVAEVLGYRLEMSQSSVGQDDNWSVLAADIGHEFYVVDDLTPATSYSFRVSARNKFGWSESSYSTYVTTCRADDGQRLQVPHEMRNRQYTAEVCDPHLLRTCEDELRPALDYGVELNPVALVQAGERRWHSALALQAEIARGRFSALFKALSRDDQQQVAVKAVLVESMAGAQTKNEFDILRSLRHEKIVALQCAYRDEELFVFVMERLSGLDVLTYLSSFSHYTEETVSRIITQVMDAIEYLHFRGMCLLELLPDNVVMTNGRTSSIKLVDFSSARFVPRSGARVPLNSSQSVEYCPPEVIAGHEVSTASDVWCIGVLTYVLLSGFSPFKGETEEETRENVRLGRYKYDHIYGNCTPEVTRFLINVFKKHSSKRPTIEQLYENKWLLPNEFMIRKRQHALFSTDKIVAFAEQFHRSKSDGAQCPQRLLDLLAAHT